MWGTLLSPALTNPSQHQTWRRPSFPPPALPSEGAGQGSGDQPSGSHVPKGTPNMCLENRSLQGLSTGGGAPHVLQRHAARPGPPTAWGSCRKEPGPRHADRSPQTPVEYSRSWPSPRTTPSPTWASVSPSVTGRKELSDPWPLPVQGLRHLSSRATTGGFISLPTIGHTFCPRRRLGGRPATPAACPSHSLPQPPARSHRFVPRCGQPEPRHLGLLCSPFKVSVWEQCLEFPCVPSSVGPLGVAPSLLCFLGRAGGTVGTWEWQLRVCLKGPGLGHPSRRGRRPAGDRARWAWPP